MTGWALEEFERGDLGQASSLALPPRSAPQYARLSAMSPPTAPPGPRPRRRWPWVLLLLGSLAWLGLVAGMAVGAAWFVPAGSGLAGPAIALGFGLLGAAAGLALGGALAWKGAHALLRAAAAVAVVLALLTAGVVAWRFAAAAARPDPSGHGPRPPAAPRPTSTSMGFSGS